MSASIIIIGAGIAGLSAGCYAQMNGYDSQIFEMHSLPGGLCTSWKRKDYVFDGCVHWLVGSSPANGFYKMWSELGAMIDRKIVDHEVFVQFESRQGETFKLYSDADQLGRHLLELSPQDASVTKELISAIHRLGGMPTQIDELKGLAKWINRLRSVPLIPAMVRYSRMSMAEFGARFKHPLIREALCNAFGEPEMPVLAIMMTLAFMHQRVAGYPVGGSLAFAQAIADRYQGLGGEISYGTKVNRIVVENDRAVGVELADGSVHRADVVISAADGHATHWDMLEGRYLNDKLRNQYRDLPIFEPIVQVSLGVNRDFSGEQDAITFQPPKPLKIGSRSHEWVSVRHMSYDPSMAPAGKSVLITMFPDDHAWWQELGQNRVAYLAEKDEIAQAVINVLEARWPGLREQVEVVDVATPLTTERYTGNWQGSMEGWLLTADNAVELIRFGMDHTVPGLKGFWMVGQWVEPGGGLPPSAQSGRKVLKLICDEDGKQFRTSLP